MRAALFALIACALTLAAQVQYPGQYPPGQYPPGRNPTGRPPNGPSGQPRQGKQQGRESKTQAAAAPTTTTTGMFRRAVGSQFVLEADDHRIITYRTSGKTTVQKESKDTDIASFSPGDRLSVDASQDDNGYFTAAAVTFEKAGTPSDRAAAGATWDLPFLDGAKSTAAAAQREPGDDRPVIRRKAGDSPKETAAAVPNPEPPEEPADTRRATTIRPADPTPDDDDPGPPSLRRGVPAPRRGAKEGPASATEPDNAPVILTKAPDAEPATVSASVLSAGGASDPVIGKAREAGAAFTGTLPNYMVQQLTTRYQSEHPKQGWDALDVVTSDLVYENGKENYKNIRVGNKPVNKKMEEIGGTYSTGEFSSVLDDLLDPGTGTVFRRSGQDTIRSRAVWVYKFDVPRERSHWRINAAGQLYYPAYRGTIWIDRQTSRVLRLEEQARNMPLLFPFDTVEMSNDYDLVRLAPTQSFLLPVNAEVLSCTRGTSSCSRNKIEFRNYKKFGAESDITFDDKN